MILQMKQLAQFIKVLGDRNRLLIIKAIGNDSRSVTEIINSTGLSQTLVSFHLRNLRDAGVVNTRREGPFIFYNIADPSLLGILDELAAMAGMSEELFQQRQLVNPIRTPMNRR